MISIEERFRETIQSAREALEAERKHLDQQAEVLDRIEAEIGTQGKPAKKPVAKDSTPKAPGAITRKTPEPAKKVVLDVLGKAYPKGLRIEELEAQTVYEKKAVKSALAELLKAGEVEKEGKARGVRYSIPSPSPKSVVTRLATKLENPPTAKRGHEYPWEGGEAA